MTVEERFERMEHVMAGLVEERKKDREEYRQLWRDTQRQINEVSARLNDVTIKLADMIAATNDAVARLAEESREADKRLERRIESLVSAMGEFLKRSS